MQRLIAAVALMAASLTAPATTIAAPPGLAPGTTWNWQIGSTPTDADIAALAAHPGPKMLDIDMVNTTASVIGKIHAAGIYVVCYLETGSWENYRPDAKAYPASVKGKTLGGYPDERYVDIRQPIVRTIVDARLDTAAGKGCDGIEPDLDDTYLEGARATGFPLTIQDQLTFNAAIAADAHARGMTIALKNGADATFVPAMEPLVDFAINEQCNQYSECAPYSVFVAHGKFVGQVEYTSKGKAKQCARDNAAGFDGIGKSVALKAKPWTICR